MIYGLSHFTCTNLDIVHFSSFFLFQFICLQYLDFNSLFLFVFKLIFHETELMHSFITFGILLGGSQLDNNYFSGSLQRTVFFLSLFICNDC